MKQSDCRSLVDHLNKDVPGSVTDKRLGIELASIHESLYVNRVP